jgi:putative SOS response-associated peptidase YedK
MGTGSILGQGHQGRLLDDQRVAQTVDTKPVFRETFQRRRCIVPVDSFYEWKKFGPKGKQPYAIILADRYDDTEPDIAESFIMGCR